MSQNDNSSKKELKTHSKFIQKKVSSPQKSHFLKPNVLIIRKRSLLELLHLKKSQRITTYLKKYASCHDELIRAKLAHTKTLEVVTQVLDSHNCPYDIHTRASFKPSFLKNVDLVITIGGDGTLLEIARYLKTIPILGVNSDPKKSIGHFCSCNSDTFATLFDAYIKQELSITKIPRMSITIDGKTSEQLILNDVYVTNQNHGEMIRLDVTYTKEKTRVTSKSVFNKKEKNTLEVTFASRCTGFLVATSAGSSAWMYNEGGTIQLMHDTQLQLKELGKRHPVHNFTYSVKLVSHMPKGIVCIDGSHRTMKFGFGQELELKANQAPILIVGDVATRHNALIQNVS
jgi:NAD+ kinase